MLLEEDPRIEVVAEAADGDEAVARARDVAPDVITMDVVMPGLDGLRATEEIMAVAPTRIVVISQLASREQSARVRGVRCERRFAPSRRERSRSCPSRRSRRRTICGAGASRSAIRSG